MAPTNSILSVLFLRNFQIIILTMKHNEMLSNQNVPLLLANKFCLTEIKRRNTNHQNITITVHF